MTFPSFRVTLQLQPELIVVKHDDVEPRFFLLVFLFLLFFFIFCLSHFLLARVSHRLFLMPRLWARVA